MIRYYRSCVRLASVTRYDCITMTKTITKPGTAVRTKTQRPPLYKVILLNDDFTPREFVVQVLKAVFRMGAEQARRERRRAGNGCHPLENRAPP